MGYGGYHPYPRRFGRAADSELEVVHRSLNQQMGTGINAHHVNNVSWLENMAAARCIVFDGWESNRRLSLQWDPLACSDMLPRWEKIFALSPDPAASLASRHQALLGRWQAFGELANDQLMRDKLTAALGPVFVDIEYIDPSKALVIVPDGSYPWGVSNAFGVTWYSTVAHILVKTQKPANYTEGQFYAAVAQVAPILDPIRPGWVTYDWYRAPVSPSLVVVGGPSASGFYLDDPHNLSNNVFSDPSAAYAAPTIASVSPNTGIISGGTAITITGTAFRVGATVDINGAACTSVVRVSSTTITAVTPASVNGPGARSLRVTNVDSQSGTLASGFTYFGNVPAITGADYGGIVDYEGGDPVTLTGTDLGSAISCEVSDNGGSTWSSVSITANTSTSLTFTMVAKAAGALLARVTTAVGTSSGYGLTGWSPKVEALTTLRRASYAGVPWTGQASAGASGGRNLTQATAGKVPATGSAASGKTPAVFTSAAANRLDDTTLSSAFGSGSYSGVALVYIDAISNTSAATKNNSAVICSSQASGRFAVYLQSDGVGKIAVYHYDSSGLEDTTTPVNISTGVWRLVHWKFDGTNLWIGFNGVWYASAPAAAPNSSNGTFALQWGESTNANTWFDGKMLENATKDDVMSDATLSKWVNYANRKYGIGLS